MVAHGLVARADIGTGPPVGATAQLVSTSAVAFDLAVHRAGTLDRAKLAPVRLLGPSPSLLVHGLHRRGRWGVNALEPAWTRPATTSGGYIGVILLYMVVLAAGSTVLHPRQQCRERREVVARGNPVRVRDCPAAVNGNDLRHTH